MSQIRKLQQAGTVPNPATTYKYQLDSQNYDVTDEQLKEIDNRIAQLDPNLRRFLGGWTAGIKSGSGFGNRANNTTSSNTLSGLTDKDLKKLEKNGTYWQSIVQGNPYYAREAVTEALNITHSVLNKPTPEKEPAKKTTRYNRAANFDYDTDASGKSFYSSNPKNKFIEDRFGAYLDWLSDEKWGDSNEWETPLGENEAILRSWYSGLGDREKAQGAIDAAMAEVRSKPWDEVSEGAKELLTYFNIGNGPSDGNSPSLSRQSSSSSGNTAPVDANGNVDTSARTDKGEFRTWRDKGRLLTNSAVGNLKPYLLNSDRLHLYGLGNDYLNGLVYKGRIYKPGEVSQNIELQDIMNQVTTANNSARSTEDVWNNVGSLIDFTDYDNHYTSYNSESHYMPYEYRDLRNLLGTGNYSLADISNSYDTGGIPLFEIYDFNNNGTNQWGFRTPEYYTPSYGLLTSVPQEYAFLNRNWNPMNSYSGWQNIKGVDYGIIGDFWGSDAHDTTPYQILEDRQGNVWSRKGNGDMVQLDADLVQWILAGNKPNHNQMLRGTLSGNKRKSGADPINVVYGNASYKQGGKVQLKPLPEKLQMGSKLSVAPKQVEQQVVQEDTPLAHASNLWETLTPADQKEITAAAVDVAGAIAGLVPGGSIAGAVSGIGVSTPLYMSAAKERKGHLDAGDWSQAVLSTGLDLISLIPYLGETGKIAKIGKTVTRVAVPLGKAFNALGLIEASSVLAKNPKDWNTDDLLKLSAGIQSVINVGHGAHVRRGESRLAHEIQSVVGNAPKERVYSRKFKTGKNNDEIDIPLDADDVRAITGSKTPGEELKKILKGYGVSDDQLTNMKSLLSDYGFDIGRKLSLKKDKRITASEQKPEKPKEYSKYGYLFDEVLDPFGNREFARRGYIDANLQNSKVRSKISDKVLDSSTKTVTTPREVITVTSRSPKNTAEGRAYVQSLARLGKAETSWVARPKVTPQESTTVDRTPGLKLEAEAAMARGEGLPNVSEMTRTAGRKGLEFINEFARTEQAANVSAAVSKAMGPAPGISRTPSVNLGAEAVSNRELRKYVIGNAANRGLTEAEAVEFLNGLSDRKRKSVLNDLLKSKSEKAKAILSHFTEETPVQSAARKVYSTPAMQNVSERNDARRLVRKTEKIASNIKKLQNSNDPMQTLREITESDSNFAQQVFDNQEEFQAALNFALSRMPKGRKSKYSKQYRDYIDELYGFLDQNNLTIFTKKGGVIKAEDGTVLGLFNKDLPNMTKYLIPGLSLGRFALNSHFQNKYYNQAVDALNAGRVDKLPVTLNAPRTDSPALDRQLQQVHLERMAGIKPATSDVIANNAIANQREAQLYNRENDIIGQQSQFGWNAQRELTNIMNQNLANQIETANDNAMRRAAIDSAIKEQAMALTQRRGQSWENLGLEIQNNLKKDRDIMLDYNRSKEAARLQNVYDENIDSLFGAEARTKYRGLSADDAAKYTDFDDYLSRNSDYSNIYKQNVDQIAKWQEEKSDNMGKWMYLNALNYSYPSLITGRKSIAGFKKGGYLRGNTRYKNEPDEQIWIDNNKSTHKAIAKLSDNTIKLLLRALK